MPAENRQVTPLQWNRSPEHLSVYLTAVNNDNPVSLSGCQEKKSSDLFMRHLPRNIQIFSHPFLRNCCICIPLRLFFCLNQLKTVLVIPSRSSKLPILNICKIYYVKSECIYTLTANVRKYLNNKTIHHFRLYV